MQTSDPKYSILIPARNGGAYLPSCVETVISQDYADYELIVSDDHSADGSGAFLAALDHRNVRVLHPPAGLSMAEHWEWILSHATGRWLMFVGQDDGVQPYFFKAADILTEYADRKGIRAINSHRAYFFWPGCDAMYGDAHLQYSATAGVKIFSTRRVGMLVLLSVKRYPDLPHMYTTSLFHREIVEKAKSKQNGRVFVTHPQDANLAAIAYSLTPRYLHSMVPLGWVGTSPKSAGMAVADGRLLVDDKLGGKEVTRLRSEYLDRVRSSRLPYHPRVGEFSLSANALYFWGSVLSTAHLRPRWSGRWLTSRTFMLALFGGVLARIERGDKPGETQRLALLKDVVAGNGCSYDWVRRCAGLYNRILWNLRRFSIGKRRRTHDAEFCVTQGGNEAIDLPEASRRVAKIAAENRLVENLARSVKKRSGCC